MSKAEAVIVIAEAVISESVVFKRGTCYNRWNFAA
jgi:hypothetical protein